MSLVAWGWLPLGLLGLAVFALDRVAVMIASPPRKPLEHTPDELGVSAQEIEFRVGRFALRGWIVAGDAPASGAVVLAVHGWAANSGTMIPALRQTVERGHTAIFFDFRGHGRSDDAPWITVRQYWEDLQAAVSFARERFPDRPLVVVGHSMGGAIGVVVVADGMPVDGLVCVASPADILEVTRTYLDDVGLPGRVVLPLALPFLWLRARVSFKRFVPERRVRELRIPLALIHPEEDRRVPREHPERVARAAGDVEVTFVPGAGHRDVLEHPETGRIIAEFVEGWEGLKG